MNPGTSYPAITVTVNVSPTASSPLVNSVTLTGSGSVLIAQATDSTVIQPHGPATTIQASVAGAPFSLDSGTVYQAPVTFYWANGEQHTVTWLTALPGQTGAVYTFQSWSDGGSNPRTITAGAAATYTATIGAEFLLNVNNPNPAYGTVTVSPPSANGYYAAGTAVTLTSNPAPGIFNQAFSGDVIGWSPLSITMNGPVNETATFTCADNVTGLPSYLAPGPVSGFLYWAANPECSVLSITSSATWFTLGSTTQYAGYTVLPYSISENTGDSTLAAKITISGQSYPSMVYQQPQATYPVSNLVSVSPNIGTGSSQVFTFQVYIATAATQVDEYVYFTGTWCSVQLSGTPASPAISLFADTGGYQPLTLPGSGSLSNSACAIDAAASSISVSGNLATIQLALTFTPAEAGFTSIEDGNNGTLLGLWTIPADPSAPALSVDEYVNTYPDTFNPGQTNVPLAITVSNAPGAAATSGTVTVSDTLAAGLSLVSIGGTGWSCTGTTCSRSDSLAGGSLYPPIDLTVNIAANATPPQYDVVTVTGGGSASFATPDQVYVNGPPTLQISSSHTGSFIVGQTNASYTIVVSNLYGSLPTSGPVTVTDNLPPGLSLVSMTGTNWTCTGNTCSRSDSLASGSVSPTIVVTVSVATTATSPQINSVTASGGGSATASASDSTVIVTNPALLSISLTDNGPFYSGESGTAYTVVISN